MTILSASLLLFMVMDPLGNVPMFISILSNVEPEKRTRIIIRELLIALGVLSVFLFAGRYMMSALQLTEPSLSISGGIILFIIALKMIFPPQQTSTGINPDRDPFIVPLAIPLVAGPSAMALILLMSTKEPERLMEWMLALLCAWTASSLILVSSNFFGRILGKRGLTAIERLMGMICTAIAVEMFLKGIRQFIAMG
ncbi:MAG: YhgN family NAAT transporter [Calditrichaeota bacterium]|nr:YhgN family NAAT transporter [Deltaproteobacteria bacterium]MBT7618415.1 YhgN family NAAT transporter [Calditrichota bacterium]MBT7790560.1 YhgN family NAAT transporter [Calditrichota bacterium]